MAYKAKLGKHLLKKYMLSYQVLTLLYDIVQLLITVALCFVSFYVRPFL